MIDTTPPRTAEPAYCGCGRLIQRDRTNPDVWIHWATGREDCEDQ